MHAVFASAYSVAGGRHILYKITNILIIERNIFGDDGDCFHAVAGWRDDTDDAKDDDDDDYDAHGSVASH